MKADRRLLPWLRRILPLLLLGTLAVWSLAWGSSKALTDSADLCRRIQEIRLFRQGLDPYADPDATYPPSSWPVFETLIPPLSEPALRLLWLALNFSALAALVEGLRRWLPADRGAFWTCLVLLALLASKPVRAGIALGQFHLIPSALAVWAVLLVRSGSGAWAGLLLGLALIKPTMVLPLVVLLAVRRQWSAVLVSGVVQALCWAYASLRLGLSPRVLLSEWLANARFQEAAGTLDLPSLLTLWGFGSALPSSLISALLLVLSAALFFRLRQADDLGLASLALLISALFAYHRHYDLVLMLPAVVWLASRRQPSWRSRLAAVYGLFLIIPVNPAPLRAWAAIYEPVFLAFSYAFILAVVWELVREARASALSATASPQNQAVLHPCPVVPNPALPPS